MIGCRGEGASAGLRWPPFPSSRTQSDTTTALRILGDEACLGWRGDTRPRAARAQRLPDRGPARPRPLLLEHVTKSVPTIATHRALRSLLLGALAVFGGCKAAWTPMQLSLAPGVQWFDEKTPLHGAGFGLVTKNEVSHGVQLGLLGAGSEVGGGVAVAPFVGSRRHFAGVQCGWFVSCWEFDGLMLGFATNPLGMLFGMDGEVTTTNGAQLGMINGGNHVHGVQVGGWNMVNKLKGVQVGLINATRYGGLQIGLLNFKEDGFLPFFPLFNF